MKVGFAGLGVMGAPMAGHLLDKGFDLTVWNRTAEKMKPLVERGAKGAKSLEDLAVKVDLLFLCVNRTEDVRECIEAVKQTIRSGSIVVDHSTIEPGATIQMHGELSTRGVEMIDAPVTGGSMGAQAGTLTVFCGGDEGAIEKIRPVVASYAKRMERVGGPGTGQTAKLANQIAVAGALLALCEALSFAKKAGLELPQIRELIGGGAGGSWAFEHYGAKILERDWTPGFSISNQRKDLSYCRGAAIALDAAIPGAELVDRLLQFLDEEGRGEWTTAALYEQLLCMGYDA